MEMPRDSVSVDRPMDIEEWRAQRRAKKKQDSWVVVIVVLAISVALLSFLYVFMSGGGCSPTRSDPNVQFSEVSGPGTVIVAGVSRTEDLSSYMAVLIVDGAYASSMNPLREGTVDQITFTDLDSDGKLSFGDYFTISTVPNCSYKLSVIWRESGNERGYQEWGT